MRNYDYILVIITIVLLAALGVVFLYGTAYSYFKTTADREWTATPAYATYLDFMNKLALPFALGLTLVLGLCIPKRIVPHHILLQLTAVLVFLALLFFWLMGARAGLGFLLITALLIQVSVILMILAGHQGLKFEYQGFLVQLGSASLHLGLIIFVLDLILLQTSPLHIAVFWVATFLITVGSICSFYSEELSRLLRRLSSK